MTIQAILQRAVSLLGAAEGEPEAQNADENSGEDTNDVN